MDTNRINIKYIKLINHINSNRREWSANTQENSFTLGWVVNSIDKPKMSESLLRKEKDAKKAQKGDQILLCQNHFLYGHRVTHVVKIIDESTDAYRDESGIWTRRVEIIWVAERPWEKNAPCTEDVIGKKFSFRNGNLINVNSRTINLNLDKLNI